MNWGHYRIIRAFEDAPVTITACSRLKISMTPYSRSSWMDLSTAAKSIKLSFLSYLAGYQRAAGHSYAVQLS